MQDLLFIPRQIPADNGDLPVTEPILLHQPVDLVHHKIHLVRRILRLDQTDPLRRTSPGTVGIPEHGPLQMIQLRPQGKPFQGPVCQTDILPHSHAVLLGQTL